MLIFSHLFYYQSVDINLTFLSNSFCTSITSNVHIYYTQTHKILHKSDLYTILMLFSFMQLPLPYCFSPFHPHLHPISPLYLHFTTILTRTLSNGSKSSECIFHTLSGRHTQMNLHGNFYNIYKGILKIISHLCMLFSISSTRSVQKKSNHC